MEESHCYLCRKPKVHSTCEVCQESVCKNCARFLEANTFAFLQDSPEDLAEDLRHTWYCSFCFDSLVEPELIQYQEIMERSKGLYFFFNTQKRLLPVLKKSKEDVRVSSCEDRNETILRLAFKAAQQGYNSIIEAEVGCKKVRDEGYQKSVWTGVGIPAVVDSDKLERAFARKEF